jgi:hypothetical protein
VNLNFITSAAGDVPAADFVAFELVPEVPAPCGNFLAAGAEDGPDGVTGRFLT